MQITAIEPAWNGNTHLPANMGLLRILRHAYPDADVTFVAGQDQIDALRKIAPQTMVDGLRFIAITPAHDKDTLYQDVSKRVAVLRELPANCTTRADLIVLCSCTATVIAAINRIGLASKCMTFLHGNANDISGWRSKNPFRRFFDFKGSIQSFCKKGGKLLVYEQRIKNNLAKLHPWLDKSTHVIGHPLVEEESPSPGTSKSLGNPIKIGFPGMATIAKGFPEFLALADSIQRAAPGIYEFHSIGYLHDTCKDLDQSSLKTKPGKGLPRKEFIDSLLQMDFLFTWHNDNYYSNAASGVIYDAINLGIPVIAKRSALIDELNKPNNAIGLIFNTIEEAKINILASQAWVQDYPAMIKGISEIRKKHSTSNLANTFSAIFKD